MQNGAELEEYYYDPAGHRITVADGSGNLVRNEIYAGNQHVATYANGTTYFDHDDWLGTERARTDLSGNVAETCTSLAFGDWQTCSGTDESPVHFAGMNRDIESGLDYTLARQYTSQFGGWMSPDPDNAGADPSNPQTWDAYSYALNNPTTLTDPEGTNVHVCVDTDNGNNSQNCFNLSDEQYASLLQQQNGQQGIGLPTGNFPTGSITCGGQVCGTVSYYEQGLEDQTANLLAFAGLAEGVARGAIALGEEGFSALGRMIGVGGEEAGSTAGVQALNIGRFVTGQALKRTIQTADGPLDITATVEVRGSTVVLRNFSVASPGGVGVNTNPGVIQLKAAFDALKGEFAADGFSRLIVQGLRITGANAHVISTSRLGCREVLMSHSKRSEIEEDLIGLKKGGADIEALLGFMRERGLSQIDSSLMLARICRLDHGQALKTVFESSTWADRLEDNIKLQQRAMQAWIELSKEGDPNFKIEVEWEPESPEDDEAPGKKR